MEQFCWTTVPLVLLSLCVPGCKNENIALNKPVKSSTVHPDVYRSLVPSNAVDGNTDGDRDQNSCFTTWALDPSPWWMVDLGRNYRIHNITIYNRDAVKEQLHDFFIEMFRVHPVAWSNSTTIPCLFRDDILFDVETLTCDAPVTGRYVRMRKIQINEYFYLCEVEITGSILSNQDCDDAHHIATDDFNGQKLETSNQRTVTAASLQDCINHCRFTVDCLDINFNRMTLECQLITARADDDELVPATDWVFVSLP